MASNPKNVILAYMKKIFSISILFTLLLSLSHFAVGQTTKNRFGSDGLLSEIQEQVSFSATPSTPQPGEVVSFRVESFSTNLNKGSIVWFINGVESLSGVGNTTFSATTPRAGERLSVEVVITTQEGNTVRKNYSITAASVALIYEANSYTPPFYKGKALFPLQGDAQIIAIPNVIIDGEQISRDQLIYTWSVNNRVMQDMSGFGRSTYFYNSDILSQNKFVSVEVSAQGSDASTEGEIFISPTRPEIIIYEKSSAYGIVERNLADITNTLFSTEIELAAYPFFMSARKNTDANLTYDWSINGKSLPIENNNQPTVLFRNENNSEGLARISARITESNHLLQSLSAATRLQFQANTSALSEDVSF